MASPTNPLTPKQPQPSPVDLMLNGIPAAQNNGQAETALAQMLGPQKNLSPFLGMGGPQYADELDEMEWNPMAAWY